jgi:Xaa-Pro dipeptidase
MFLASGWRTHIPHATWTAKVIEAGENVPVELTGVVRRYAGPLFRTYAVGPRTKWARDYAADFEVVKAQLEAAIGAIGPGVTSNDVHMAVASAAREQGRAASFNKRTGYSVGLNFPPDWGEGYLLDLVGGNETVLEPGMTFHLPMSLRGEDDLSIAVSETVLVTEQGCEVLTKLPRELIEV